MIEREEREGVRVLRMAHGRANAFDVEFLTALAQALGAAERDARAIVLTGTGPIFCAGVDLVRLRDGGDAYLDRFLPALDDALLAAFSLTIPAVAAINGHAVAGGWILAAACEHRLVADGPARLGVPELRVGVPFPLVATEILRASTPAGLLDSFLLAGATHAPSAALSLGLVHGIVPPEALLDAAVARARELAESPHAAYARTKQDLREPGLRRIAERGREHALEIRRLWASDEVRAAIARHVERTLRK